MERKTLWIVAGVAALIVIVMIVANFSDVGFAPRDKGGKEQAQQTVLSLEDVVSDDGRALSLEEALFVTEIDEKDGLKGDQFSFVAELDGEDSLGNEVFIKDLQKNERRG